MRADCRPDDAMADAVVVTIEGLFEEAGAVTVWQEVTPSLDSATPFLLVDLAGVNRITSAGVGALVRLLHRVRSIGGGVAVFGAGTRVREVIEAVRLDQILNPGDIDRRREGAVAPSVRAAARGTAAVKR